MTLIDLPTASTRVQHGLTATGQVKAFLVHCSISGSDELVGRDSVIMSGRNAPIRYFCSACKSAHDLHLWPQARKETDV